jgi:hypothetical protein
VSVDLTDPAVTCQPRPTYLFNQADATVAASVTDAGSGPARPTETVPVTTTAAGKQGAPVQGFDVAGRTTTTESSIRVVYVFGGWGAPMVDGAVNVVRAGTGVPLRWRVLDATGLPVTTVDDARVTSAAHRCDSAAPQNPVSETATGDQGLQNLGDGYYQYDWSTRGGFASSCRTVRLDLGDDMLRTAEVRFTG